MPAKASPSGRAFIRAIGWYQSLRAGRVSPCRFYPSCSNYAIEAIEVHGLLRGLLLATRRISRCRPLGAHGIDLVPTNKKVEKTL